MSVGSLNYLECFGIGAKAVKGEEQCFSKLTELDYKTENGGYQNIYINLKVNQLSLEEFNIF